MIAVKITESAASARPTTAIDNPAWASANAPTRTNETVLTTSCNVDSTNSAAAPPAARKRCSGDTIAWPTMNHSAPISASHSSRGSHIDASRVM